MCQNSNDKESEGALYFRMLENVKQDNRHIFVRLINRLSLDDKEGALLYICSHDAANCLAAVLEGVGGQSLITYYVSDVEKNMPLHGAARGGTPKIASLLIDKGFSADLRGDYGCPPTCLKNALPLNVALDYTRLSALHWNINYLLSPVHQIIYLCRRARKAHKIIRVLARNTKEIKHEFFKYLKQGKVFEVGALLAIAHDLIMSSSSTNDGENGSIGFKNIMEMRQFLLAEMSRSLIGVSNKQLMEIKKTLRLLEIFDRVGDKLLAHMPMWDDYTSDSGIRVASLIKHAAYDEKEEAEVDPAYRWTREHYERFPNNATHLLDNYTTTPYYLGHWDNCTRKFSTQVHSPSWLEDGSSHVDAPLPLPALKGVVTKRVSSKKHASFTRAFSKAIRHLRYR